MSMNKNLFLLSAFIFFSCNKDDVCNDFVQNENNVQISESFFNVERSDIEKIVNDFFYKSADTRSHDNTYNIVAIDSVNTEDIITRSDPEANPPRTLLYFVKLADGSTIIVGGDKRAEPVYAHFENIELNTNDEREFEKQDSIPYMVVALIENYIVDVKNKTKDNSLLNSYYGNNQYIATRSNNSGEDEVLPKLAYRFTDAYTYNEKNNNYNLFTSQDIRPWTIHALCVAIPDHVEIRSFDKYTLKASWKKAKKLNISQLKGDMFQDFVAMSDKIPMFTIIPNSKISGLIAFNTIKKFFSGADGIPSLSYDTDWYNILNNLRLETGISYISGYRDRKHPTSFRKTSYHNPGFFLADGYKKIGSDYYIHVVGPVGNHGIVSGYVLDFNKKNAARFQHTRWREWYGTPYKTEALNIHTTKYLP